MNSASDDFKSLLKFLVIYQTRKSRTAMHHVEQFKNRSVDVLMHKRGRFQKHVWHTSMLGLASVGVLSSGVIGGDSMVASSFPGSGGVDPRTIQTFDPLTSGVSLENLVDFKTSVSDKPRSEIIDYEVKSGDTLSTIAQKFNIDVSTIKWANDLESVNSVKPGQTLKILPVTGVAHTVKSGDTLDSVAKKYSASDQAIVDFPFNDIPDDFKLKVGQVLIIPDGSPPETSLPKKANRPNPQNLKQGPAAPSFSAPGGGSFRWPTTSVGISQYFAWYHPALDLPNPKSPPIVAAGGGKVIVSGWVDNYGFGNRVVIDHGNGYKTTYAHMSNIYVSTGQQVSQGTIIGQMGSTGRSTGTHLHFEIHYKGIAVNPLAILK